MSDPDRPDPTHRASDQAAEQNSDDTGEQTPEQTPDQGVGEAANQASDQSEHQAQTSAAAASEPVDWSLGATTPPPSNDVPYAAAPPAAPAHSSAEDHPDAAVEGAAGVAPGAWAESAPDTSGAAPSTQVPSDPMPSPQQPESAAPTNFAYPPYGQDPHATAEFSPGLNAPHGAMPQGPAGQGQTPYGQAPHGPTPQGVAPSGAMPPGPGLQGQAPQGLAPQGPPPYAPMHQGPPPPGAVPPGGPQPASMQPGPAQPPAALPSPRSLWLNNLVGSLVGLVLVAGGLALALRFGPQIFAAVANDNGDADIGAAIWTILGALLVAAPALLARWASWTPIVPGFILAGLSVWAMTTNAPSGGGWRVHQASSWAFDNDEFTNFVMNGSGLIVGLGLLAAGIGAVLLRAGVRREIRAKLQQPAPTSQHAPQ